MKTKRIIYAFSMLLITVGVFSSCVKDDDFDTPPIGINPPDIDGQIISISAAKSMLLQEAGVSSLNDLQGAEQLTFEGTDLYMEGYVVSSDEAGNFYKEMVLQDKAVNPTSGIKIMIDENPLFTKYEIGRKVYVELDGFTIGFSNGVISLGITRAGSDYVDGAPEEFVDKIIRTTVLDSVVPLEISISDFSRQYDNLLIKLDSVEFPANIALGDNAKTFAAEPGEQYDAQRTIESCESGNTTTLLTSTFAGFKAMKLPKKSGSITAILSKTFNGSKYVLKINDPSNLHFTEERCDGANPGGPTNPGTPGQAAYPFTEDFESLLDYDPIDNLTGWTNQNVSGNDRVWLARSFDNNQYAQMSAYQANGAVETWMITPGVDLSGASAPVLTFKTEDGYYNGDALKVYVSTDFAGDATTATWTELTNQATINQGHSSGYGQFIPSGEVDLSTYVGQTVYIGFKYVGDPNGVTSTYQVDDVSIAESGSGGGGTNPGNGNGGDNPTPPSANASLAFAGGDFEDWNTFIGGLNSYGIQSYATESNGTGINGSAALQIVTDPSTTSGNDYVFTALATANLPTSYSRITFYMKGTADKSVSINVYSASGYHRFNLETITTDAIIEESPSNQYDNGTIDTNGEWVLIELDLSQINDLNTTDTSADFFALKIGKNSNYNLQFDNFTIE